MGLPQAEYHFKSAVIYGSTSIEATDAYLPAGAFHKAMAEGMLELTRSLMQISDRLDALAGGTGPTRPTVDPGSVVGTPAPVLAADPPASPGPAASGDLPLRGHQSPKNRPLRTD